MATSSRAPTPRFSNAAFGLQQRTKNSKSKKADKLWIWHCITISKKTRLLWREEVQVLGHTKKRWEVWEISASTPQAQASHVAHVAWFWSSSSWTINHTGIWQFVLPCQHPQGSNKPISMVIIQYMSERWNQGCSQQGSSTHTYTLLNIRGHQWHLSTCTTIWLEIKIRLHVLHLNIQKLTPQNQRHPHYCIWQTGPPHHFHIIELIAADVSERNWIFEYYIKKLFQCAGSCTWSSSTASPVRVDCPPPSGTKFLALWHCHRHA